MLDQLQDRMNAYFKEFDKGASHNRTESGKHLIHVMTQILNILCSKVSSQEDIEEEPKTFEPFEPAEPFIYLFEFEQRYQIKVTKKNGEERMERLITEGGMAVILNKDKELQEHCSIPPKKGINHRWRIQPNRCMDFILKTKRHQKLHSRCLRWKEQNQTNQDQLTLPERKIICLQTENQA